MYTLYSMPGSCSSAITVLLEKLGVPYEVIKRDDVPNYAELVPTNQVPALKTESGAIIAEGAAIALYLLEKHGGDMLPKDAEEKAQFNRWLMFNYATLHPAYSKIFATVFRLELGDAEKAKVAQQFADATSQLWEILDKRLAGQKYIYGDKPSIIDYLVTVYSGWQNFFPDYKVKLGKNVERLIDEVSALPEFKAAFAKEGKEFKKAA